MTQSTLDRDLQLLISRYGRDAVLNQLAALAEVKAKDGDSARNLVRRSRREIAPLGEPSVSAPVQQLAHRHDDVMELLTKLRALFETRQFLPNLRDVHRFLERHGSDRKHRSRKSAFKHVEQVLLTFPHGELLKLLDSTLFHGASSEFAMLANAIMFPAGKPLTK